MEQHYTLSPTPEELKLYRTEWLSTLNHLHDTGELTDEEFEKEINQCLDFPDRRFMILWYKTYLKIRR